jgi:hypothetical protein
MGHAQVIVSANFEPSAAGLLKCFSINYVGAETTQICQTQFIPHPAAVARNNFSSSFVVVVAAFSIL